MDTFERLQQLLHKDFDIPMEKLSRDARLEDLEIDSLRLIEIFFSVEEIFKISIPGEQQELRARLKTFGDLADYIQSLVATA
jgi:acyl carrier protein